LIIIGDEPEQPMCREDSAGTACGVWRERNSESRFEASEQQSGANKNLNRTVMLRYTQDQLTSRDASFSA
jgi:hypothetical protein